MILVHVHDQHAAPPPRREIGQGWTVVAAGVERLDPFVAQTAQHFLFDIDIGDPVAVAFVREFLNGPRRSVSRIFVCPRGDRRSAVQAWALGATQVVDSPVADDALVEALAGIQAAPGPAPLASPLVGALALDLAFRSLDSGETVSAERYNAVAGDISEEIGRAGIETWLQPILSHHAGTYRHCLLVTGLASGFGRELGLGAADMATLTLAALLHDVGKAGIPRVILDKPGVLTSEEIAIIKTHAALGDVYLRDRSDVSPAIRDVVRHHHEYLDGSGYPDGLKGAEIGDLTRLVTIADIFAALVEERAYKKALSAAAAMAVLTEMGRNGKVETALVQAFAPVAGHLGGLLAGPGEPPAQGEAAA